MRLSLCEKIFRACFFLFFIFMPGPFLFAGADELRVEGIVFDEKNPQESIAVINGATFQPGDTFQGVKIVSIRRGSVMISDPKLPGETELRLTGGIPSDSTAPATGPPVSSEKPGAGPSPPAGTPSSGKPSWNPLELLNMVRGVQVLNNLRQLYTGASVFYSEEGGGDKPLTLKALAERHLIPSDLASGELGGYRYAVRDTGNGVEATADPVIDGPNSLHYLIDDFGNLRQEVGRPATSGSHRSGGGMTDETQSKMQAMAEEAGALPPGMQDQ